MIRHYVRLLSLPILLAALGGFSLGPMGHAAGVGSPVAALHSDEAPIVTIDEAACAA
jgi:hypothetical protein